MFKIMATGLDHGATGPDENENALLGYDENVSTGDNGRNSSAKGPDMVGSLMPTIQALQSSMASVANGMQKMGDAWAALAGNKTSPKQLTSPNAPSTSGTKRRFADMEEDDEDLDYDDDVDDDDHDDVASLMKEVSASGSDTRQTGEESDNDSLLDNISANYDEEDDVGPDEYAKLASIANKAFKYSGGAQSISVE